MKSTNHYIIKIIQFLFPESLTIYRDTWIEFGKKQGYKKGYSAGNNRHQKEQYNAGYKKGYKKGYDDGYYVPHSYRDFHINRGKHRK